MKLPIFKSFSKPLTASGIFNGINSEGLLDSVNLVCGDSCSTRSPRRAIMLYDSAPDQIIVCENHLFFRFGNTLKEMIKTEYDGFIENGNQYALKNYGTDTDRKLIIWEDGLYVLPDNIQIGNDVWYPFAENDAVSVSMPFVNARTLFYTSGYSGEAPCNDAIILTIGMKLRFSWLPEQDFTIKTLENKNIYSEDGSFIDEGIRITLDADVTGYNAPPSNAKIKYCNPKNRPLLNDLVIGYNHTIRFIGRSICFSTYGENYNMLLTDYLKIGQTVNISGSSVSGNNVTAKIENITDGALHFNCDFTSVDEKEQTVITFTPVIPDFSHFLLTEDRLFGVDNSTGKFYISALKKPFLFYDNPVKSEDAWEVKINGTATGIALWKDNIICFTESGGFRILGYTALNFGIRQLSLNGIKNGCGDSLVRVGDTLYYYSEKGIMKYSGGSDKKISDGLMQLTNVKSAITDGAFVYMLTDDRIWVYNTDSEIWWSENAENISHIFNFDSKRYLCTNQAIYLAECDSDTTVNWSFALHPLPDKACQKVQPLNWVLSYSEDTDCVFTLYSKAYGEAEWKNCGVYPIKGEGVTKIPLCQSYCNGFKIKAEGYGKFSPEGWTAYYRRIK